MAGKPPTPGDVTVEEGAVVMAVELPDPDVGVVVVAAGAVVDAAGVVEYDGAVYPVHPFPE